MIRKLILCSVTALSMSFTQAGDLSPGSHAAIADGITTQLALSAGASEMNPLLGSNPSLPLVLGGTALKVWLSEYMKDDEDAQKIITGIWAGAAGNNLAVIAGVGNPVLIGIAVGIYFWKTTTTSQKKAE